MFIPWRFSLKLCTPDPTLLFPRAPNALTAALLVACFEISGARATSTTFKSSRSISSPLSSMSLLSAGSSDWFLTILSVWRRELVCSWIELSLRDSQRATLWFAIFYSWPPEVPGALSNFLRSLSTVTVDAMKNLCWLRLWLNMF